MHEHVTQLADDFPFFLIGLDGWREGWAREAFILRESKVETATPETDLFAGLA
jgi:mycothiol S-conjugate amidase